MKFLVDISEAKSHEFPEDYMAGQLITPLTSYRKWSDTYAVDNGAFSGFNANAFTSLLSRLDPAGCLFVCCPDIVGSASRTLDLFQFRQQWISDTWPIALVAQDGLENMLIPWSEIDAIFIGGGDPWKDSKAAVDIAKTAKILGKHVHVGRVNTARRFELWHDYADTCDGSGVCRFSNMIQNIKSAVEHPRLFS